jgi:hypothetical protein
MKGIVFALNKNKPKGFTDKSRKRFFHFPDFKYLLRRYGAVAFFTAMLIFGLATGTVVSKDFTSDTLSKLDFLFTTNLPQRLTDGAVGAFCAGFASNFLFWLFAVLMGLSLWGIIFLPATVFVKGFGIGVSAGYLFTNYSVSGLVFYLAILLPGIFLFSMGLVYQCASSYNISKKLFKILFLKEEYSFKAPLKIFFKKSLVYLLCALLASVLDMALWFTFAGLFSFN